MSELERFEHRSSRDLLSRDVGSVEVCRGPDSLGELGHGEAGFVRHPLPDEVSHIALKLELDVRHQTLNEDGLLGEELLEVGRLDALPTRTERPLHLTVEDAGPVDREEVRELSLESSGRVVLPESASHLDDFLSDEKIHVSIEDRLDTTREAGRHRVGFP